MLNTDKVDLLDDEFSSLKTRHRKSPLQKSANHLGLPALSLILCGDTHARQKVTYFSVRKPILRHLSYRLNDPLFAEMGRKPSVRSSVAVRNLSWSEPRFSLLLQRDSKLDQSVSNGGPRGKYFLRNLGYRAAVFDVFFFEESFGSPGLGVNKINHLNEIDFSRWRRGNGSFEFRLARHLNKKSHLPGGFFYLNVGVAETRTLKAGERPSCKRIKICQRQILMRCAQRVRPSARRADGRTQLLRSEPSKGETTNPLGIFKRSPGPFEFQDSRFNRSR